jgi:hypothetical protein
VVVVKGDGGETPHILNIGSGRGYDQLQSASVFFLAVKELSFWPFVMVGGGMDPRACGEKSR